MTPEHIAPSKSLGYSDIYLDFVAGNQPARNLYCSPSVAASAEKIGKGFYDRDSIADILMAQNKLYGSSKRTFGNIERLKNQRSVCVITGQQAGLLTGPMLTIIKALSVIKAASQYQEQQDIPVIPMFWIAGDDHDFEEANHTFLLNRSGELKRIAYNVNREAELPTADTLFSDTNELLRLKEEIHSILGDSDFTPELYRIIDESCTASDSFVTAFGKLMAWMTSEYGLVLFNPSDIEAKRLAIPFFRKVIELQNEITQVIDERNKRLRSEGYHIQVEKKEESTHLFYNDHGRQPMLRDGDQFIVSGQRTTKERLVELLDSHPERFSPDVITRPLLQSYLFPTVSQKGGPSEIAYLAQINPLFKLFELPIPFYKARASLTLIETRFEKLMESEDISLVDLRGDIELVVNRVLGKRFPSDLDESFNKLRRHIQTHFEDFTESSLAFDPSLQPFAKQTFGKIDFALKAYEGKIFSAHKRKLKEMREKIYRLTSSLAPERNFQERSLNITYFISKYGKDVIKYMYESLDCEQSAHQLIKLSGMRE